MWHTTNGKTKGGYIDLTTLNTQSWKARCSACDQMRPNATKDDDGYGDLDGIVADHVVHRLRRRRHETYCRPDGRWGRDVICVRAADLSCHLRHLGIVDRSARHRSHCGKRLNQAQRCFMSRAAGCSRTAMVAGCALCKPITYSSFRESCSFAVDSALRFKIPQYGM